MSTVQAGKGHQMHSFEYYPSTHISRSKFNRSHSLITTMNAGYIVPIWHDMAYPGDTLILSARSLCRLATQIVPFMSNVYMDIHFWCVPIRLIWEHWTAMNGEQPNPGDSTDYLTPQITSPSGGCPVGSLFDYFNIPIDVEGIKFNAFNFRAYNLVYNEWYRDENLQNRVTQEVGDTSTYSNFTLLKRGKRKDYFTGALPWPLKNGTEVDIPLGTSAPVSVFGNGNALGLTGTNLADGYTGYITTSNTASNNALFSVKNNSSTPVPAGTKPTPSNEWNTTGSYLGVTSDTTKSGLKGVADLSSATAATINSLRQAFAVQRMLEKDARGGTRYIEMILSHFGVKSPDARLQRPEFLGGATFDLDLSVVPQTSSTNSTSPLGELASYGVIRGRSKRIVHSFTEHCVVFGVASIRAEYYYQQGLERDYSKRSRIDFYLPVTANLGEQAILNKEIYCQAPTVVDSSGNPVNDNVFGYQERWSEMRYKNSYITGQTRSTATQPLDIWHLGQEFASLPTLNSTFIEENPPIDRVIAVAEGETVPQFICNFFFDEQWVRPMPVYSIPSMSSHF